MALRSNFNRPQHDLKIDKRRYMCRMADPPMTGHQALMEFVRHVLNEHGAMEVTALAREFLRRVRQSAVPAHLMKAAARLVADDPEDADWVAEILIETALTESDGLAVSSYPNFRLRQRKRPESLPSMGWQATAYKVLSLSREPMPFNVLYDEIVRTPRFRYYTRRPRAVCYWTLTDEKGRSFIVQSGRFYIKLNEQYTSAIPPQPVARSKREVPATPGVRNIHETHLESLIVEDLDHIEPGLTLIGRQYQAPPVGRIDLLCRDRKGNIVVIEIKKFGAATDSIIDQITRYMGWARRHVPKTGQHVRGIIIVGKPDEKLGYAASSVPELSIKVFDVSLRDHPIYR